MTEDVKISSFSIGLGGRVSQDLAFEGVRHDGQLLVAIADGVGGSSDGALAAKLAMGEVEGWLRSDESELRIPFERADSRLKSVVSGNEHLKSLATTLSVVVLNNGTATFAHVGDCRIYHLRSKGLRTVTHDQTEVAKLLQLGVLSRARARDYPRSNVLVSALGASNPFELQQGNFSYRKGDRILLCSDGLYKSVDKKRMSELSSSNVSLDDFVEVLQSELLIALPTDDATALVVDVR